MTVLDRARALVAPNTEETVINQRLARGRARHAVWKPYWAEETAFYENRQFVYRTFKGSLSERRTEFDAKPEHRARTQRNYIFKIVNAEVSSGTQRTPGYQVIPSSSDPEDIDAAKLSEKALLYFHERLDLRKKVGIAFRNAVITGEGFARPYWNPDIGPELPDGQHEGDIGLETYAPDQVFWEPGVAFEKSKWHAIDHIMSMDQVNSLPKRNSVAAKADTVSSSSFVQGQLLKSAAKADTCLVTEYLELPSPNHPHGRRFYLAGNKAITETETYPAYGEGPDGPEPCLIKISYVDTPDRDRDMGLVEQLIDSQRTINDCINKQIEWKNLALNPQAITGPAGFIDPLTSEPNAVFRTKGDPNGTIWRDVPAIPPELDQMILRALDAMYEIAAQRSIPSQIESGKAIAAINEQDDSVRSHITQNLATFYSKIGKRILLLMQQHYTEDRLIKVNGRMGTQHLSFTNADLRSQTDVVVLPGSIEPRTKEAVERRAIQFFQMGWITSEQAMAAINGGTAEQFMDSYERDIERAQRIIQLSLLGPEALFAMPPGPDGSPGWMPRQFDKVPVHKSVFEDFFKTVDYETTNPGSQLALQMYYSALLMLEAMQAQRDAMLRNQMAEEQGMVNAAKTQNPKPMPSLPGGSPQI